VHAMAGLDALLCMLRARSSVELLDATSRLQSAIQTAPTPRGGPSSASGGGVTNGGGGGGSSGSAAVLAPSAPPLPSGGITAASPTTAALASALARTAEGAPFDPHTADSDAGSLHPGVVGGYAELLTPSLAHGLLTPGLSQSLGQALEGYGGGQPTPTEGQVLPPSAKRQRAAASSAAAAISGMAPPKTLPPSMPPPRAGGSATAVGQSGGSGGSSSTAASGAAAAGSTGGVGGGAAAAAAAADSGVGSKLRKKRPPGATDLSLVRGGGTVSSASGGGGGSSASVGALGSSIANVLGSGGCLSGVSLSGVLETPHELKQFASQLSPHFGLMPDAMVDFLATDDVIAQISSPRRSARGEAPIRPSPLGADQK
jgi:hypothetical protein